MNVAASNGSALQHLADPGHPGPAADEAERHVGAEARRRAQVVARRPTAARRRRRPTRRRGRRRPGSACPGARAPCARRPPAPGARGCRRRAGTGSPGPPITSSSSPSAKVELVGEVERDHLGVDEVVAVGAHAGDAQRQGQLGAGALDVHAASLPHAATSSSSARASGRRPQRRTPRPAPGRPASRRSILRRWPNPARTSPNSRSGRRRTVAGSARRTIDTSADSTLGWGTNTVAGTRPTTSAVGPVRDLHRHGAVGRSCPAPRPAARRPRAAPSPACARSPARRRAGRHERRGDVVRQVGDERPHVAAAEQAAQSSVMASPSTTVRAAVLDARPASTGTRWRSISTADDVGTGLGQRERERAEPGADLDDRSPGPTPARRAMRRTVLGSATKFWPSARADAGHARRAARRHVGRRVGHQLMLTSMTPCDVCASCANVDVGEVDDPALDERAPVVTTHVVDLPFARLVTRDDGADRQRSCAHSPWASL